MKIDVNGQESSLYKWSLVNLWESTFSVLPHDIGNALLRSYSSTADSSTLLRCSSRAPPKLYQYELALSTYFRKENGNKSPA